MSRQFTIQKAVLSEVPVFVGLSGASGSGKTFSALRLAAGMQRVTGGEIVLIDTESRRATHYANDFDFRHMEFKAPFGSLDYLAAIEAAVAEGGKIIIVDSMSHEHEGPGGVLEGHEKELDRLAGDDVGKRNKMSITAWAKPKAQRRRLLNSVTQLGVNGIFCFRAKEKIKPVPGKQPVDLGWQAITGDEFIYEMTASCLLYPASGGVPTWTPDKNGERSMVKLPKQFMGIFEKGEPLSEDIGQSLVEWARGREPAKKAEDGPSDSAAMKQIEDTQNVEELTAVAAELAALAWDGKTRAAIRAAINKRKKALG